MSDKRVGFSVSAGVLGRISSANKRSPEHSHFLRGGDIHQMGIWEEFLRRNQFDVGNQGVYPALRTEDEKKRAIQMIWEKRVEGWWNLNGEVRRLKIATEEEIQTALRTLRD